MKNVKFFLILALMMVFTQVFAGVPGDIDVVFGILWIFVKTFGFALGLFLIIGSIYIFALRGFGVIALISVFVFIKVFFLLNAI